ncbi:peptidase M43 family protein [Flavihumibacter petaseus NBRC 106054]|uniref:Peptidase M43 family protein n=2 Tax=Flavihumibacter TaxID=1004301 RepID=A0A0E9N2T9_9BACT|nr:peptidase M43 family protein [Flavihumibacter petaseus NBRC 106054]
MALLALPGPVFSQGSQRIPARINRCAADTRLKAHFAKDENFRRRFLSGREAFRNKVEKVVRERASRAAADRPSADRLSGAAIYSIPVVFHIVLQNPASVSDATIMAQLDTLNKCFAGENDQRNVLAGFKSRLASTNFSFCLAQRGPDGLPATGIVRKTTNIAQYESGTNDMKDPSKGGSAAWDTDQYLNIWITNLSNGILGFSSFPDDGDPDNQGVVVDPDAMPGSTNPQYNEGKTLVHECGHFFNLIHIWGDEDGCSGSDDVADTPNQGAATYGFRVGVVTDGCTTTAPGIMYQNFLDYTDDVDLLGFTSGQVARMELALTQYRLSLTQSQGCAPVNLVPLDGELYSFVGYSKRICTPSIALQVQLRNRGTQTITAAVIRYKTEEEEWTTADFTGSIPSLGSVVVSLPAIPALQGIHPVYVELVSVNGVTDDGDPANNFLTSTVQYYPALTTGFTESFEDLLFPPVAWDTLNPDGRVGWERFVGAGKTGFASVRMHNFEYDRPGAVDWLRPPQLDLSSGIDSAFLSFQVAAATYTDPVVSGNNWDTLEVVVSTDCGATYTSLYKKWGATLVTVAGGRQADFVPAPGEWRKDSVDLTPYAGKGQILVAFKHTAGFENNVYLDDIQLREVRVFPNLKAKGMLVYPNPTHGLTQVQFYPQPTGLKALLLFNAQGALVSRISVASGTASNTYSFDLSRFSAGVYLLKAVFDDRVEVRKVVKQ